MKIKYKITFLFTLLVTAILLSLSISIYYFTSLDRKEGFYKRLKSRANNNAQLFVYFGDSSQNVLRRIDANAIPLLPQKSVRIFDTLGNVMYAYDNPGGNASKLDIPLVLSTRDERSFNDGRRDGIALFYNEGDRKFIIAVQAYDEDGWLRMAQLKKILFISLLVGVFFTMLVGYLFSAQLVRPISQIIHEVNDISSHNLSHRLQTSKGKDELAKLADTFNNLLNRLQESFNTQRRFISNASHELSTPLTSISSQLQVTLQNERSAQEYQQVLHSIHEDVQQMGQLTKSLLEIAKTGTQGTIELREVRIDEVLLKVIGDVKKMNQEYEVALNFGVLPEDEKSCMVFGNVDLLYSALKNIIENGCKYSPDKRSIVELSFREFDIVIRVMNKGDVIAEEEIEQIFQPFFRSATTTEVKGFGLGLALARRIVGLHKGVITVESDIENGTRFTITLPSVEKL
ncbi:MAG TPA: HAMP domain-containing sensor histidine kinase [Chitinophagaceae bacterium]